MKFKQVILNCEVFPITICYQELGTAEQFQELCEENIWDGSEGWSPDPKGKGVASFFGPSCGIWMHKDLKKSEWREFLTHEILHATVNGLTTLGLELHKDSLASNHADEPFCYLQQWACRELGVFE